MEVCMIQWYHVVMLVDVLLLVWLVIKSKDE
nr:MAG TPA: hypothetical protein [Caudoviricetes sp.]